MTPGFAQAMAELRLRQTAGLMGWTGSQQDADFVALSPELDPQEDE